MPPAALVQICHSRFTAALVQGNATQLQWFTRKTSSINTITSPAKSEAFCNTTEIIDVTPPTNKIQQLPTRKPYY